jgi:hypothetical protein
VSTHSNVGHAQLHCADGKMGFYFLHLKIDIDHDGLAICADPVSSTDGRVSNVT